ncbi:hypothetical protein ACFE04_008383 [Oxalis oulophora]
MGKQLILIPILTRTEFWGQSDLWYCLFYGVPQDPMIGAILHFELSTFPFVLGFRVSGFLLLSELNRDRLYFPGLALPTSMPIDTEPGPTLKESATSGTADRPFPLKKKSAFTATQTSTKKETIHYSYGSRRTTTETSRLSGEQELGPEKSYTPVGRVILKLQALKRATVIGLVESTSSKATPTIWLTILKRTGCAQLMIATSTLFQYPSKAEALDLIGEEKAGGELPIAESFSLPFRQKHIPSLKPKLILLLAR